MDTYHIIIYIVCVAYFNDILFFWPSYDPQPGPSCVLGLLPHMHGTAIRQDIEMAGAARAVLHPVLHCA